MPMPRARGKYTSSDLRQIIAADKGDDPRWPLRVAEKQKRSHGAIVTLLGKLESRGVTFSEIEEAMDAGIIPERFNGFESFLTGVHKHLHAVAMTSETSEIVFDGESAIILALERIERKIDLVIRELGIAQREYIHDFEAPDQIRVSTAEEYAKGDLHGVTIGGSDATDE